MDSRLPALAVACAVVAALFPTSAAAAEFAVDVTADNAAASGCTPAPRDCSLRNAIVTANATADADRVVVPAGTYRLTIPRDEGGGQLGVLQPTEIVGAGPGETIIDAEALGTDRVLEIRSPGGPVRVEGLTLRNGSAPPGEGAGGGIAMSGTVTTLRRVRILDNAAGTSGGGIMMFDGTMLIEQSRIAGNTAGTTGGGIHNERGNLVVLESDVADNSAPGSVGGGIYTIHNTTRVIRSLIRNNSALQAGAGLGGGHDAGGGAIFVIDSTVTGNVTGNYQFRGGYGAGIGGDNLVLTISGSTITNNTSNQTTVSPGPGGLQISQTAAISNTIIALNTSADASLDDCGGVAAATSGGHNLIGKGGCGFTDGSDGDQVGSTSAPINPLLAALADNGGPTLTHALTAASPAINAGDPAAPGSGGNACSATDQRRAPRPFGSACDIGAFEFGATPPPVDPDPAPGAITPTLGETAGVRVVKGTVLIGIPSGGARAAQKGIDFVPLEDVREIPIGSFLDTTNGTVALTTAKNRAGKKQTGRFAAGLFQVLQSRKAKAKGLTELRMKGSAAAFRRCRSGDNASASLSRRAIRRLRARARGRFRTRSRYSAATVRGTTWTVEDRCDGTLTKVKRGKVAVRDFRRKKTIVVSAGKSYLAAAAGASNF